MSNPIVHLELPARDNEKAKSFYAALFGWTYNDVPTPVGPYSVFKPTEGPGGGIFQNPGAFPNAWLPYIGVKNLEESRDQAIQLGAQICKDITTVEGMGRFVILTDPQGAQIALWQTNE